MKAPGGLLLVLLAVTAARPVAAHVGLHYPPSRYGDSVLKEGPCGVAGGARSGNVTELASGARIEVMWDEYVNHPGHFRISFDPDGDDGFVDPQCLSGCNSRSPEIETYSNDTVLLDGIPDTPDGGPDSATVTLPDIECDRCTLQLIQVMYDKPPYAIGGNDIYYQCADLLLRRQAAACPGDCDGDGQVTVDELIIGIGLSLDGASVDACRALDSQADGHIDVGELIRAVESALRGCGS